MMESHFKIAVVGLGLIGASMAMALRGFKNAEIVGVDNNPDVVEKAKKMGFLDDVCTNHKYALEGADLIVICIYPDYIVPFIEENAQFLKHGAVVTDVCGVKEKLAYEIEKVLPDGVQYVGGHPMAGKEIEGIDNAEAGLFQDCGYIITTNTAEELCASAAKEHTKCVDSSAEYGVKLVCDMARYIGAAKIAQTTPKKHDEIIAYTSDLMHISAAALCLDFKEDMTKAYAAGAFRDSTRVARINPELWSELFLKNKEHTLNEVNRFINSINRIKNAIENDDRQGLYQLLDSVRRNKEEMESR